MAWRKRLCRRLPQALADRLLALGREQADALEEIRIYAHGRTQWIFSGGLCSATDTVDMDGLLCALCAQALYSCENQLAEGYIPLPDGHRAGVCGVMRCENGVWRMGEITSVCIRIGRSVRGASAAIRPYLLESGGLPRRVLLLGAPGCGKTTVLRDAALWLACDCGLRVAVADEREELFSDASGLPLDVMRGIEKAKAFSMLLRSMAPRVIVTDEIGRSEDVQALEEACRCGVGILASAHAGSVEDARRRPALVRMMAKRTFDRYILLGYHGRVLSACDESGQEMDREDRNGQLGCGGDGDDCHQCDRVFAIGWGEAACAMDSRHAALSAPHERHHPV